MKTNSTSHSTSTTRKQLVGLMLGIYVVVPGILLAMNNTTPGGSSVLSGLQGIVTSGVGSVLSGVVVGGASSTLGGDVVSGASSTIGGVIVSGTSSTLSGTVMGTSPQSALQYYPNAAPTLWYALPGQWLGFYGIGFAPGETIRITGGNGAVDLSATADGAGAFNISQAVMIPFEWQNTTRTFTIRGNTSQWPSVFTIVVGTFYPQISPSTYWIGVGQSMSVSGISFAPGEHVRMYVNDSEVAQTTADGAGNVSFSITAPSLGSSATLSARGVLSGLSSTRVIYLRQ
ncbi:hypothetical protein HYT05_02375 [Candidatus Kaiserbacteria bacterium]|nr:hypothetical protein [Candidatus Kaiserbacteria bacterium]